MGNIAIIPARSGSKGLIDKNIKLLNGKPMLAYTVESAIDSGLFDEVMVSTDSFEYAKVAKAWGASVPFLRQAGLAGDTASSWDVVKDVLVRYAALGLGFHTVALLQPTSPLRSKDDLVQAYQTYYLKEAKIVIAVCEADHSPLWMNTLPEDHSLQEFIKSSNVALARQALPKFYRINGAIYIADTEYLLSGGELYGNNSYATVMPKSRSIDIDDGFDFAIAEAVMRAGLASSR